MLSQPGFGRGSPAQILMRTNLVVPPAKSRQLLVQLRGIVNQDLPDLHFKGPKESLDPAILPGAMGIGRLVADAQQPQPEPEQPAGEDGFVVGANNLRLAKLFDGIQQTAKQGDGRFVGQPFQGNRQPGMVFADTEYGVKVLLRIGDLSQVDAPVLALRYVIGGAVFDLAPQHVDFIAVLLDGLWLITPIFPSAVRKALGLGKTVSLLKSCLVFRQLATVFPLFSAGSVALNRHSRLEFGGSFLFNGYLVKHAPSFPAHTQHLKCDHVIGDDVT